LVFLVRLVPKQPQPEDCTLHTAACSTGHDCIRRMQAAAASAILTGADRTLGTAGCTGMLGTGMAGNSLDAGQLGTDRRASRAAAWADRAGLQAMLVQAASSDQVESASLQLISRLVLAVAHSAINCSSLDVFVASEVRPVAVPRLPGFIP
jgi:hypothetical protein